MGETITQGGLRGPGAVEYSRYAARSWTVPTKEWGKNDFGISAVAVLAQSVGNYQPTIWRP